jgi:DNA-directed RNA polymerase subunit E'/Rpb7
MPTPGKKKKDSNIYSKNVLSRDVHIRFSYIGNNIQENLQKQLEEELEGKCISEGFVKNGTIKIINYSSGVIKADKVIFRVSVECDICKPVEGMIMKAKITNITKAGIKCVWEDEKISPVIIFIARDHNHKNKYFHEVETDFEKSPKQKNNIKVKVIGIRYELNDEKISVLAELVKSKTPKSQPKLNLDTDKEVKNKKKPKIKKIKSNKKVVLGKKKVK